MNPLERVCNFFEHLQAADLARLDTLYGAHAYFRDPFNEVRGLVGIRRVFEHMFEQLEAPRFEVLDAFASGDQAFLTWNFRFRLRGREVLIHGSSHLKLAPDGKVIYHRDYWDAAEELWERLPLLGSLLRRLKRRLRAGS